MGCLQERKRDWMKAKATFMSLLRENYHLDLVVNLKWMSQTNIWEVWHPVTENYLIQEGIRISTKTLSYIQRMDSKEWQQGWGKNDMKNEICLQILKYDEKGSSWNFSIWTDDFTPWEENYLQRNGTKINIAVQRNGLNRSTKVEKY